MKFGKKEKETQEEEVVRGEIQRVVPDYRVGLNPEQIRIREENGWTNDEVAPPGLTTKEIVHNNIFTYFNLIFLILAILLCLVGSFRNLTFLPVIICNTLIGIIQEIRSKKVLDRLTMLNAPHAEVRRISWLWTTLLYFVQGTRSVQMRLLRLARFRSMNLYLPVNLMRSRKSVETV